MGPGFSAPKNRAKLNSLAGIVRFDIFADRLLNRSVKLRLEPENYGCIVEQSQARFGGPVQMALLC